MACMNSLLLNIARPIAGTILTSALFMPCCRAASSKISNNHFTGGGKFCKGNIAVCATDEDSLIGYLRHFKDGSEEVINKLLDCTLGGEEAGEEDLRDGLVGPHQGGSWRDGWVSQRSTGQSDWFIQNEATKGSFTEEKNKFL